MTSDATKTHAPVKMSAEAVYAIIADKVRTDSETLFRLTHVEALAPLLPDMTPEEIVNYLGELYEIEEYMDVRAIVSDSGAAYLFSSTFIPPEEAADKCLAEETQVKIATLVRDDSKTKAKLTGVEQLAELFPSLSPDQLTRYREGMAGEKEYEDIKTVAGPARGRYLYSETYMTQQYAALLARAEAKDPCLTIAETVREESRIYPRPTKVQLFYAPVFQIDPGQMEQMVERTLQQPECADIHKIVAVTGAIYLYSNRYMEPALAERWVQWEEVERLNNP
jgi:hypothetical protein